jgi:hypothetical protein
MLCTTLQLLNQPSFLQAQNPDSQGTLQLCPAFMLLHSFSHNPPLNLAGSRLGHDVGKVDL